MVIKTIHKTAVDNDIPENLIRTMVKTGEAPGFYRGTRYYILEQEFLIALREKGMKKRS